MRKVFSRVLIAAGAALLLFACASFVYNRVYDQRAGQRANDLLEQMMAEFDWDLPPLSEMTHTSERTVSIRPSGNAASPDSEIDPADSDDIPGGEDASATSIEPAAPPVFSTIGIISIPALGVRLPVISEWSDELLEISVCRLSGLVDEKPIRLVIIGHNIRSHFGGLDNLQLGDEVAFTTRDGVTFFYAATEITDLHRTGGADVLAATGWDLTLITCKTDRTMRTMIRFAEVVD